MLLLITAVILGGVVLRRLALWRIRPKTRWLTAGILALFVADVLDFDRVERLDSVLAPVLGQNATELFRLPALLFSVFAFGASNLAVADQLSMLSRWAMFVGAMGVAALSFWFLSAPQVPVDDEIELIGQPYGLAINLAMWAAIGTSCLITVVVMADALTHPADSAIRRRMVCMLGAGAVGLIVIVCMAGAMSVWRGAIVEHHDTLTEFSTLSASILMAMAGIPSHTGDGLVEWTMSKLLRR